MIKTYHLTILTTGLTSQQVRTALARLEWEEVFCQDWTMHGRQYVRWHGTGNLSRDTSDAHAALVDQFQEYTALFTLLTRWGEERERCPDCHEPIEWCYCELLGDGIDDAEEDDN